MSETASFVDLAWLVAPAEPQRFIACFLQKERLFVRSIDRRRAEPLLARSAIDRLVFSDYLDSQRLHVLRNGEVVPAQTFRNAEGRIRADALQTLIDQGVSLVVNGIDREVPQIGRLSAALSRELGHSVWVNCYITHGSGGALAPHYDDHDVMVLQVYGSKRWFGHGTPLPFPIERSPDDTDFGPARWEELLEAGDFLYVPRGEAHHADVESSPSIHLTLGFEPPRGVDLIGKLAKNAASQALFREDVTQLGGHDALLDREQKLKAALHALVDGLTLDALLDERDPPTQ